MRSIAEGKKLALKRVLNAILMDVRSTTGKNLRYLMLQTASFRVKEIDVYKEPYKQIPTEEMWRISLINEMIATRNDEQAIILTTTEMDDLMEYACCT